MSPLALRIAHERPHDTEPVPGRPLDVTGALREQPSDGTTDVAVSEQGYQDVDCDGRNLTPASAKPPYGSGENPET